MLLVDGELMTWKTVTSNPGGMVNIGGIVRGVFDTLPADHAQGARV